MREEMKERNEGARVRGSIEKDEGRECYVIPGVGEATITRYLCFSSVRVSFPFTLTRYYLP